ncbi:MAG: type I glyceraldehyde-3-phosphate dehydrogenase [Candidatus Atribacteria bacterium]|nr:MAG: type I glyceraldehyde-3-phosphate dehydrogenase [Candidatus Atribacteria bacterium]
MKRVAINGFGRIGRAFFRLAFGNPEIEIVAINDPFFKLDMARYLLMNDSVYGRYGKTVEVAEKGLLVDGKMIQFLAEREPDQLPWGDLNIDLVIEATGVFRAYSGPKGASRHIQAGAKRVLLSVPSKGEGTEKIPQIVYGVNHHLIADHDVVSAASCTTNSLVPVMYVLEKEFDIAHAFLSTIHGYTADQQLVDGMGSSMTRSRAAAINIVPTTTGAASATEKVIPSLAGRMDGIAFRVPVPTGSVSDITLEMNQPVSAEEVNAALTRYAVGELKGILKVSSDPLVSTDIIGETHPSIVDLTQTAVVDGRMLKVVAFYDNEWGYTNQLLRVALKL